jgi:CRISPR-associated endonuclease/helicase Cas3
VLKLASRRDDKLIAQLIAYAIAGHHAGLPDATGEPSALADRFKKPVEPLDNIWRNEVKIDPTGLAPRALSRVQKKASTRFRSRFLDG